jgi:hypothetical protein
MVSDVTAGVEQHCIIKFLVKEKVKPAEIHRMSCASVCDWCNEFFEGHKEVLNLLHAHISQQL